MRRARGWTVVGVAVALAACGGDGAEEAPGTSTAFAGFCAEVTPRVEAFLARARAEAPAPADPRYGGTVVVGGIGELSDGMNAFSAGDYASRQHQQFVNLMTLVRYDEELRARPWLAESWELNEEGTELTFHLRDDVYWHDGEPTDAEDVAFTYRRLVDPATAFANPGFWKHYDKGPDGVEVLDAHTVRIRMEPHSEVLDPWRTVGIMPEHLLGDVPSEQLAQHPFGARCPVGNGPFVFQEHRPQDRWIFTANPAFPRELGGRPFVDRYVFRVIPEQTTLLTELLTEEVDVFIAPAPDQADEILADPELELRRYEWPGFVFVAWNSRRPELADARVRRALTHATDRERIVEAILRGYGTVAHSGVPPSHWAYDGGEASALEYDPALARALLEEAGWTDRDGDGIRENAEGAPLAISIKYHRGSSQRQSIAEIMQSQLREVGVDAQPQVLEWGTLLEQIMTPDVRDFDGVVMAWTTEFRLDETDLFHSDVVDGPLAFSGTENPRLDTLLEELDRTADRERARALWAEYQAVLAEEQPYTFFYFPDRLDGVNARLENVVMDPRGEWVNLKDWWIDPAER